MCRRPCKIPSLPRKQLRLAETNIGTAGPGSNLFFDISWLAVEEVNQEGSGTEAPQHGPRLTYFLDSQAALKSRTIKKTGHAN